MVLTLIFSIKLATFALDAKDSDLDGIPDDVEITKYYTNPYSADTDKDGVLDSREILDGTDPLDPASNMPIQVSAKTTKLVSWTDPIFWYISRGTGIMAFIVLTEVVAFGLLMSSKSLIKWKFIASPTALEMHHVMSYLGFMLVIAHFVALFFDETIKLRFMETFIPFIIQRNFKSAMGVDLGIPMGLGILAFYSMLLIQFTSYFRKKLVSLKVWRTVHYASFAMYLLFLGHGIFTGTDTKALWMQAIYAISAVIVLSLLFVRIFSKQLFFSRPKKVQPVNGSPEITAVSQVAMPKIVVAPEFTKPIAVNTSPEKAPNA